MKWFPSRKPKTERRESELHEAYLAAVTQHKGIIYKVARVYCPRLEDREDLIQEILIQLWRAFERYNSNFKLSTWMYRIALNVAISWYRKDKAAKYEHVDLNESLFKIDDENALQESHDIQQLYEFIHQLAPLDKALMLLYLEGESHAAIAESLEISKSNVATKIGRIKQKLKHEFESSERVSR